MSADPVLDVHRQALERLRVMGMDFAERLHSQIDEPEADVGELAVKFARVSRAVRQTIFLESRLADDERRRDEAEKREAAAKADANTDYTPDNAPWWVTLRMQCAEGGVAAAERRATTANVVQRAIAKTPDPIRAAAQERLFDALESPDYTVILDCREPEWAIARVCRDIGLSPDWAGFTDRDWGKTDPMIRAALIAGPDAANPVIHPPPEPPPPETLPTPGPEPNPPPRPRLHPPAWNA
jgi:hypothetical protein